MMTQKQKDTIKGLLIILIPMLILAICVYFLQPGTGVSFMLGIIVGFLSTQVATALYLRKHYF